MKSGEAETFIISYLFFILSSFRRINPPLLARPKEFESPTFRLGGGRSIQLSYGRIYTALYPKKVFLSTKTGVFFRSGNIYCQESF